MLTTKNQDAVKTDMQGRESKVELVYIKGTQVNFLILPGALLLKGMVCLIDVGDTQDVHL